MTWPPNLMRTRGWQDNPLVECGCGRSVNADMMLDVRALPVAVRGAAEYLCDACVETIFRRKIMMREAFYRALGAPPTLIAKAALRDARDVRDAANA